VRAMVNAAGFEPADAGIKIPCLRPDLATRSCWSCQRELDPRSPALKEPYSFHQAMAGHETEGFIALFEAI
jgi:hypothetical protein